MTAIVGVHGVGNYIPGQPADKVAARRSADWAASVAAGLGIRPDALDLTVAYYAPLLHAGQPTAQAAAIDPDRALDTLDPDTQALAAQLDRGAGPARGHRPGPAGGAAAARGGRRRRPLQPRRPTHQAVRRHLLPRGRPLPGRRRRRRPRPGPRPRRRHHRQPTGPHRDRALPRHRRRLRGAARPPRPGRRPPGHPRVTAGPARCDLRPPATPAHRGTGLRPANVRRWVNISDHGDPIAILRPFKTYFPGVDLDLTESVSLFDFHRAARYLACASLAATLQPLLQQP